MTIEGHTNVLSQRLGRGSLDGLAKDLGRFVVATMEVPWLLTKERLGGSPLSVLMVDSMEVHVLEQQLLSIPECDCVVGIGGGQAIDLAKYIAWKRGLRLVSIPTVLSVDAFVTPAVAVRRNHVVSYEGTASPDPLVIDYELLRTAPAELNIAGIGDLLSIHTAAFDWCLAAETGRSEYPFSPLAVQQARDVLNHIMERASEIRNCTDAGLQAIVDGYLRVNTICLPAGHYRVEEGSEHYVFYELEERLGRAFIHGHITGLGIYLMSRLQDNQAEQMQAFMDEVRLKYQPADMQLTRRDLERCLSGLHNFVRSRPHLWYTIINEREITPSWIKTSLAGLRF